MSQTKPQPETCYVQVLRAAQALLVFLRDGTVIDEHWEKLTAVCAEAQRSLDQSLADFQRQQGTGA